MKHILTVLLCLLLCGCTRQASPSQPEMAAETSAASVMAPLYDPDHPMEKAYPGLVRAYPLASRKIQGICALENDILLFSGQEHTTLTRFTGDALQEAARLTLNFTLLPEDPSLQIHGNRISYFDPVQQATIVLDRQLQEVRRIAAPAGLSGSPILSAGEDTLFYCTGWSVVAWELENGIRRTVRELSCEHQELTALHLNDRILECRIRDEDLTSKLLISAEQGTEIQTLSEDTVLHTEANRYFASVPSGFQTLLIFGEANTSPEFLLPVSIWDQQFFLPYDHAAVTVFPGQTGIQLNYYELNTGILRSALTLEPPQTVKGIVNSKDHSVYILAYDPHTDCDVLYRWDVLRQPPDPANVTTYKADYRPMENPDVEALEACVEYAKTIGEKYGIGIRVWEDAVTVQPWDYRFTPEHLAPVLQRELQLLEKRLAQYPEEVLQQTVEHFTGLTICLVRQISGSEGNPGPAAATGIQFYQDHEAYVVITTGNYSEQALYHELYHVMETHILTDSTALDQWESLNPTSFSYGTTQENADVYLQGQTRAFADRYSMTASKEDRARVLENAMLQGKHQLFQSEYMQRKLFALCSGIREAYKLKKYPEVLPWEQYLINPLIPAG